jgi:hypothetical protein
VSNVFHWFPVHATKMKAIATELVTIFSIGAEYLDMLVNAKK